MLILHKLYNTYNVHGRRLWSFLSGLSWIFGRDKEAGLFNWNKLDLWTGISWTVGLVLWFRRDGISGAVVITD